MFKGTEVALLSLVIDTKGGRTLSFDLAFRDGDGRVHGTMRHTIPLEPSEDAGNEDLAKAAKALAAEVLRWGKAQHFDGANTDNPLVSVKESGLSAALDRAF